MCKISLLLLKMHTKQNTFHFTSRLEMAVFKLILHILFFSFAACLDENCLQNGQCLEGVTVGTTSTSR